LVFESTQLARQVQHLVLGFWFVMQQGPAMVIPLNPEGMEIGEWLILFFKNFEGMRRGIGNSNELCS